MKLSVIVPQALRDNRRSIDFVHSWCNQADVDPADYEVIVAMDDNDNGIADRCRSSLRPCDRVVMARGENAMHFYEFGIGAARGQLLLFTEDHVRAGTNCVSEVLKFFQGSGAKAAFLRAAHINGNRFARHEAALYERQLEDSWLQPDCWDRIHLRGCVVDRDLLEAAGGFPWRYGLFCPALLATRIHRLGEPVEYCGRAIVHHTNLKQLGHLHREVRSYVRGECRYRDEGQRCDDETYFGTPVIWRQRVARTEFPSLEKYRVLGKAVLAQFGRMPERRSVGAASRLIQEMAYLLPEAVLGARLVRRLVLVWAYMSYQMFKHSQSQAVGKRTIPTGCNLHGSLCQGLNAT